MSPTKIGPRTGIVTESSTRSTKNVTPGVSVHFCVYLINLWGLGLNIFD